MALQMSRGRAAITSGNGAARISAVRVPAAARMIVQHKAAPQNLNASGSSLNRASKGMHASARISRAPSRVADAAQMEPLAPEPEEEDFDLLSDKIAVLQTQVWFTSCFQRYNWDRIRSAGYVPTHSECSHPAATSPKKHSWYVYYIQDACVRAQHQKPDTS